MNKKIRVLVISLMALVSFQCNGSDKPNFLIIIGDDCTYNDLPLYGGKNVDTPNLDKLASQSLTFNRAYLSVSMCNPCRTELYTGLYPARNGACWNHSSARPNTKSIVHYLKNLGYRVGLTGKKHVNGKGGVFLFENIKSLEVSCIAETAKYDETGIRKFIGRNEDQPFCLIVGLVVPHAPWTVGNPDKFVPEKLQLPPNIADTPTTRKEFADYLAEVEVMDEHVGRTLKILKEVGHADDTVVIFTSEQGSQWPGNKWTCYNTGSHTGLIVRSPGNVSAGKRTDALVQYADVVPTLVELAGGNPGKGSFDGSSFAKVLTDPSQSHRDFVYLMHNNIPEGPPYPIRAITDGKHHYIRNLQPENLYIEKHMMGEPRWAEYWNSWMSETGPGQQTGYNEDAVRLINRFMNRPAEELYRQIEDPYEMKNLIDDPKLSKVKQKLSKALDEWMSDQGDPGASVDTESAWRAGKTGNHTF